MDSEERMQAFKQYIETCEKKLEYVGLGNPSANILLIGKEPNQEGDENKHILKNIHDIKACFENGALPNLYKQAKPHTANHTWNKYQKLINYIFERECKYDGMTDFCTYAFTTEINNTVCKTTASAKRKYRIDTLRESSFIQDFPVIILACSDYIHNIKGDWQINETFNVRFDLNNGAHTNYSKGNWYFTHHSLDRKKLVIHTRQLSQNCDDQLLRKIAEEVRDHLEKLGKL